MSGAASVYDVTKWCVARELQVSEWVDPPPCCGMHAGGRSGPVQVS